MVGTKAPAGENAWNFLLWVGAAGLLATAIYLALAVGTAPYNQFAALGRFVYHDQGFTQLALPLTPARLYWLRGVVLAAAALGIALLLGLRRHGTSGLPLIGEFKRASHRLVRRWRRLPMAAQLIAAGLVVSLVGVRAWYLALYPLSTDEVASYDYFVREGPLAISSFYPIPNNHILFNLLASPLAAAGLSPRLAMRLPTLLLGTAGTVAGYALLTRLMGLRLATLITGLIGLMPLWVYYAAVGRGYFVQFCLLQVGFFASLELLRSASPYRHLGWFGFISSSVLGLYTIPTFAYPLASLVVGMGGCWLAQRRWQQLGQLLLAAGTIGVLAGLLYAPVMAVSGLKTLVSNRYVTTQTADVFWAHYRGVLYETAAALFGPSLRLSGPGWLAAALLGTAAVRRWVPAGPARQLGNVATAMVALPLVLMAAQRVYAPVRTILYVSFFGYALVVLLLARLPIRRVVPKMLWWPMIMLLVLGIGSFRLYHNESQLKAARNQTHQIEQAYNWLQAQPTPDNRPAQIWMNAQLHELFFTHFKIQDGTSHLVIHTNGREDSAQPYDFLVLSIQTQNTVNPAYYHQVYHDGLVTIFSPNSAIIPVP